MQARRLRYVEGLLFRHPANAESLVRRDRRGKTDPHEETRKGLREVLQLRRAEAPSAPHVPCTAREVLEGEAVDFPKVHYQSLSIVVRLFR